VAASLKLPSRAAASKARIEFMGGRLRRRTNIIDE
jgi:hypothetical protein